ncbi:hypothetical protein [Sphingobium aromaticiconvertens]|uniref:hypothetical protein n=1 Tax=Sphingobium aromaticiconvertens TaxID=365341 RepID=UPI003016DE6A
MEVNEAIPGGERKYGSANPIIANGGSGCTVGVEIGRDRLTCVLLDFDGQVMACQSMPSEFPSPHDVIRTVKSFTAEQLATVPEGQREGFLGFGIAMPWFIAQRYAISSSHPLFAAGTVRRRQPSALVSCLSTPLIPLIWRRC